MRMRLRRPWKQGIWEVLGLTSFPENLHCKTIRCLAVLTAQRVAELFGFLPENVANPQVLNQEHWRKLKPRSSISL